MIPQRTNIYCIIVHFGSHKTTNRLITQLKNGTCIPQHIIVVDNGGGESYTNVGVAVVKNSKNLGYAGGINAGMQALHTANIQPNDIIVCMNNDIEISSSALEHMMNNTKKNTVSGHHVWGINLFTGRTIQQDFSRAHSWYMLPYVHGSILVATRASWKKIIPLPEAYFMYWEDVLLSLRAKQAGMALMTLPVADIFHKDTKDTLSDRQQYYLVRNGAAFLRSQTPGAWRIYWTGMYWVRLAYHLVSKKDTILRALRDSSRI